jgi:hypothetical protein
MGAFVERIVEQMEKVEVCLMISIGFGGEEGIRTLDTALDRITV